VERAYLSSGSQIRAGQYGVNPASETALIDSETAPARQ
jgi:hypothetical protein